MTKEEIRAVRADIHMAIDAMNRSRDGLDQVEEFGIRSLTYTARQLSIALRHIAAACEPIMREID